MFGPVETPLGGLMAIWADAPPEIKRDYDHWYDTEHLVDRRSCPGFLSASRFEAVHGSDARLALYELVGPEVLESPEYLELRRKPATPLEIKVRAGRKNQTRIDYRLRAAFGRPRIDAPFVYTVRLFPAEGHEAEVAEWLDTEHAERLLGVQGCRSTHAFEPLSARPFHFLNVWGLDHPGVPSSDAWQVARYTPWREKLAAYRLDYIRGIYRRV